MRYTYLITLILAIHWFFVAGQAMIVHEEDWGVMSLIRKYSILTLKNTNFKVNRIIDLKINRPLSFTLKRKAYNIQMPAISV